MPRNKSRKLFGLKLSRTRLLILSVALVLALGTGGLAWARYNDNDYVSPADSNSSNGTNSQNGSNVNLNPPSDEEISETEDYKQNLANQPPPSSGTSGKKAVTPVIVNADKYGARAYVNGIFEDGGTCTATFVHGQDKISATSKGFRDYNHTSCEPMTLQGQLNISGDWTVTVSYSSTTAEGKSAPQTVKVE